MIGRSTHYSNAQTTTKLNNWAERKAKVIIARYKQASPDQRKPPLFCYTGMSGVSHATALSLALKRQSPRFKFGMAYVRKDNERSHGCDVEHCFKGFPIEYEGIFVDDFVCNGNTYNRVKTKIFTHLHVSVNVACLYSSKMKRYIRKELGCTSV